MPTVRLPHNWQPRDYQRKLWAYLENGGKRAAACWHRRAGKDDVCLHWAATAAMRRVGGYWHMLPQQEQARKAIWDAINPHTGIRRIEEAFPLQIRAATNATEMKITLKNGSIWQLVGSDNFNSLVGSPPVGVVFSEWSLADPQAWAYMRPILLENDGWALFIFTPRGRNHAHKTLETARKEPGWFGETLTVAQTKRFTAEQLESEHRELVEQYGQEFGEAAFQQEYYCSFDAAIVGAYYAKLLQIAETENRITSVPREPGVVVHTAWDLGIGDQTAIWFCQVVGREVRLIDYYEASGVGLEHYAKVLKEKPYVYGEHILPHDAEPQQLNADGKSIWETLKGFGIKGRILPKTSVDDGINAARLLIPKCWFDRVKCERGLEALRQYRTDFDDKLKAFRPRPLHDWTSHAADAFRYLAQGLPGADAKPKALKYEAKGIM